MFIFYIYEITKIWVRNSIADSVLHFGPDLIITQLFFKYDVISDLDIDAGNHFA